MNLWVRSQNRKQLIKADYVSIMENNVINVASSGWDYDVAKYKTEKSALDVLDTIQKIISTFNTENGNYVYEMPLDYEDIEDDEDIEFDMLKALNTDLDDDVEMG